MKYFQFGVATKWVTYLVLSKNQAEWVWCCYGFISLFLLLSINLYSIRCWFWIQVSKFSAVIKYYFIYSVLLLNIISLICCPRMKYDIWCSEHEILFEFSAVYKLCGFSLMTYINVCIVRCCSTNCKIFCAVNETYCFSLVLLGN